MHPVRGLKADMRNRLVPRKRHVGGWFNELFKNKSDPVRSRRPVHDFLMDTRPALTAHRILDDKPEALPLTSRKDKTT